MELENFKSINFFECGPSSRNLFVLTRHRGILSIIKLLKMFSKNNFITWLNVWNRMKGSNFVG